MQRLPVFPSDFFRGLQRGATYAVCGLVAIALTLTSAPPPVEAGNKGLGAAAVGLAAGVIIGGAIANSQKQQARPQARPRPKKSYKKKTYTKKKSTSKKKYTKKKSSSKKQYTKRSYAPAPVAALSDEDQETLGVKNALFLFGHLKSGAESSKKDRAYRDAVKAYQKEKRLAATGVLDPTQTELLLGEARSWKKLVAVGPADQPPQGFEGAKRIQTALNVLGHYDGPIDGKLGRGSAAAIEAYQIDKGLPATGSLSTNEAKSKLIRAARSTIKTDLDAVKAQFAQISRQQFASFNGGNQSKPEKVAAKPAAKKPAPVATKPVTGTSTPSLAQGFLPKPDTGKIKRQKTARFAPIDPVKLDAKIRRPNDVAVIIGNRDYQGDIPDVAFGHRDAQAMKSLLVNDLGFSTSNIIDARDAGQAELVSIFGSASNNRGKVWRLIDPDGKSNVFVFYSGHGAPDTQSRTPYLMPVDSHPDTIELNGYPLSQMYANLESLEVKSVAVFLDACFSGGSAAGMLTKSASPVAVTAKMPVASKSTKLTVLAAAEGDQLASWNEKSGHGMFTNYLVDGLKGKADKDGDKSITSGELHEFVYNKVRRSARREFGRIQTPVLMGKDDFVLRKE